MEHILIWIKIFTKKEKFYINDDENNNDNENIEKIYLLVILFLIQKKFSI